MRLTKDEGHKNLSLVEQNEKNHPSLCYTVAHFGVVPPTPSEAMARVVPVPSSKTRKLARWNSSPRGMSPPFSSAQTKRVDASDIPQAAMEGLRRRRIEASEVWRL